MNKRESETCAQTLACESSDWKRVSSFKPQFAKVGVVLLIALCAFVILQDRESAFPSIAAVAFVSLGLVALTCKFVHKRDREYRVSSIFDSEIVSSEDVCLHVKRSRWWWTRHTIHLRRPTRFGWAIKYVAVQSDRAMSCSSKDGPNKTD